MSVVDDTGEPSSSWTHDHHHHCLRRGDQKYIRGGLLSVDALTCTEVRAGISGKFQ